MVSDGRYLATERAFKRYAWTALCSRFANRAKFEEFYASLRPDSLRDEFLRVTSFYLFLVKRGEWHVNIKGSDAVVDYLSNSYKLAALFSLIESLSDKKHQDFYGWLSSEAPDGTFPIMTKSELSTLNQQYKRTFGSIRRCVSFFEQLPSTQKETLCRAIMVDRKPLPSIKEVAKFLYDLRSKFVHEGRLVLQVSGNKVISIRDNKVVQVQLSPDKLLDAFEQGVLAYFGP